MTDLVTKLRDRAATIRRRESHTLTLDADRLMLDAADEIERRRPPDVIVWHDGTVHAFRRPLTPEAKAAYGDLVTKPGAIAVSVRAWWDY